jgi:hypothetical protein
LPPVQPRWLRPGSLTLTSEPIRRFTQILGCGPRRAQAKLGLDAVCFATMSLNRATEADFASSRADQFATNAISCVRKRTMRVLHCVQGGTTARAR